MMHNYLPNLFIFIDQYNSQLFKINNTNIGVIYRNYNSQRREKELIKIAKACKKKRYPLFVSNDIRLAIKFKAKGIYIPAFNKTKRYQNLEKKNIIILGSAHNQKEIKTKITQKCYAIFLSPIFHIKKNKKYLDVIKFNLLSRSNKINIFALGGISLNNINKLKILNIKGLGGISVFKKKPASERPVFLKNKFF
tara:strand:- start:129 stop:710 length:582 start_codon:yes stop_codon:yes gene_type:complete